MSARAPILATTGWNDGNTRYRIRVVGGLTYHAGNARPYFSITAEIDRRNIRGGRWTQDAGGCLHDEIERRFPGKFSDLIALHLSDDHGVPMHAEANGWYHLAGALGGLGERYHAGNSKRQIWNADGTFDAYREPTRAECLSSFAEYVRVPIDEARRMAQVIQAEADATDPAQARAVWAQVCKNMRARWLVEALQAIARHGLRVSGDTWKEATV